MNQLEETKKKKQQPEGSEPIQEDIEEEGNEELIQEKSTEEVAQVANEQPQVLFEKTQQQIKS